VAQQWLSPACVAAAIFGITWVFAAGSVQAQPIERDRVADRWDMRRLGIEGQLAPSGPRGVVAFGSDVALTRHLVLAAGVGVQLEGVRVGGQIRLRAPANERVAFSLDLGLDAGSYKPFGPLFAEEAEPEHYTLWVFSPSVGGSVEMLTRRGLRLRFFAGAYLNEVGEPTSCRPGPCSDLSVAKPREEGVYFGLALGHVFAIGS